MTPEDGSDLSEASPAAPAGFVAVPAGVVQAAAALADGLAAALREFGTPSAPSSDLADVRRIAFEGLSDEQLAELVPLLEAWVRKPNDLLVLVKLSEQSQTLIELARTLTSVRRALSAREV